MRIYAKNLLISIEWPPIYAFVYTDDNFLHMEFRIFTLPFGEVSESFPDEIVTEFCLNKKVHQVEVLKFPNKCRCPVRNSPPPSLRSAPPLFSF